MWKIIWIGTDGKLINKSYKHNWKYGNEMFRVGRVYNAPKESFVRLELSSGLSVLSMRNNMSSWSLGNPVVLKKLGSSKKFKNDQYSKWKMFQDEENEGWMFIQESKYGQYLRASDSLKLTTDGMLWPCNNRQAFMEALLYDL